MSSAMQAGARYVMIGGFLGAGKTTAVLQLARHLKARGLSVGLITNDQSSGLVDSSILKSHGFPVEEIGGGCFCCRFDSLDEAVGELNASTRPDVFVAEPVGSCTDLVATVSYPLRRIYGDRFTIAPLSVLVDPQRAARVLGLSTGRAFSPKVEYVYRKQLEEADLIVVNKVDLLEAGELERLQGALREQFPQAEVMHCSAREADGLEPWFERLLAEEAASRRTMELDYADYAEGEALLGWLNCTISLEAEGTLDGNQLLLQLCTAIKARCNEAGAEIAHLKMTLDSGREDGQLSVISLVSTEGSPDVRESLLDGVQGGKLIVNLRAEADPDTLQALTQGELERVVGQLAGVRWELEHSEHFRPAAPQPTHRITTPG